MKEPAKLISEARRWDSDLIVYNWFVISKVYDRKDKYYFEVLSKETTDKEGYFDGQTEHHKEYDFYVDGFSDYADALAYIYNEIEGV